MKKKSHVLFVKLKIVLIHTLKKTCSTMSRLYFVFYTSATHRILCTNSRQTFYFGCRRKNKMKCILYRSRGVRILCGSYLIVDASITMTNTLCIYHIVFYNEKKFCKLHMEKEHLNGYFIGSVFSCYLLEMLYIVHCCMYSVVSIYDVVYLVENTQSSHKDTSSENPQITGFPTPYI